MIFMRLRKTVLVSLIFLGAISLWVPRQLRLAEARETLAKTSSQKISCDERMTYAVAELEKSQRELAAETARRIQAQSDVAKVEQALAKVDPDSFWSQPPASLPEWNVDSPFIWLRKEVLPTLPISAFTKEGTLNESVAVVLALDETQKKELNAALEKTLADYHALETAKAERVKEHLPGIGSEEGDKVTICVSPLLKEGKQFKETFIAALRNGLGEQRSELLVQGAGSFLDTEFSSEGDKPKTITVVRHKNGTYSIATKSGGNWFNTSGFTNIDYYVPSHLLPLFKDVMKTKPDGGVLKSD